MIKLNNPTLKLFLGVILLFFGTQVIAQTRSKTPVLISKDATIGLKSLRIPVGIKNQTQRVDSKMTKPVILSQYVEQLNGTVSVAFNSNRSITDVWVSKNVIIPKDIFLQHNRMISSSDNCEGLPDWEFIKCRFKEVVIDVVP